MEVERDQVEVAQLGEEGGFQELDMDMLRGAAAGGWVAPCGTVKQPELHTIKFTLRAARLIEIL